MDGTGPKPLGSNVELVRSRVREGLEIEGSWGGNGSQGF